MPNERFGTHVTDTDAWEYLKSCDLVGKDTKELIATLEAMSTEDITMLYSCLSMTGENMQIMCLAIETIMNKRGFYHSSVSSRTYGEIEDA